jgi:Domain of unknown function (DUF6647)
MQILLTAIATWLSINFSLPAVYALPRVEFVQPEAMRAVRLQRAHFGRSSQPERTPQVEAFYEDATHTIYLAQGWTGKSPAELSVLVHEMVHHVQNAAALKYACAAAREKLAYAAQDRWLALFGRTLMDEFKLDPMTVLVRTKCMH